MKGMLPALVSLLALVFVFLVTATRALAQGNPPLPIELKVVGDNTPVTPATFFFRNYCGPANPGPPPRFFDNDLSACDLAQAFTLSSPAWVNRLTLTFVTSTGASSVASGTGTYPVSLAITGNLNSGPVFFQKTVIVTVPLSSVDEFVPLSISFPPVFLPKGGYYLMMSRDNDPTLSDSCGSTTADCALTWAPNQIGSTVVGNLGQAFCYGVDPDEGCPSFGVSNVWAPISMDPNNPTNLAGTNGTFAFELDGPLTIPPGGGGVSQIARLVAGPVRVAPGVPVEATLGFLDTNGNQIGPTSTVSLGPGQIQSLDLNLTQFVSRSEQHVEVQPFIAAAPSATGAPSEPVQLPATIQILDALTGFETALTPVLQPGASAPDLAPQVLAGGQTMRITVAATPLAPCNATLGFTNQNGVALGPSEPVSLTPGTATSLDLSASTVGLSLGKRIEVQPTVTPTAAPTATGAPANSVCQVTVELFESATGRTMNSQSTSVALPAQQTQ